MFPPKHYSRNTRCGRGRLIGWVLCQVWTMTTGATIIDGVAFIPAIRCVHRWNNHMTQSHQFKMKNKSKFLYEKSIGIFAMEIYGRLIAFGESWVRKRWARNRNEMPIGRTKKSRLDCKTPANHRSRTQPIFTKFRLDSNEIYSRNCPTVDRFGISIFIFLSIQSYWWYSPFKQPTVIRHKLIIQDETG